MQHPLVLVATYQEAENICELIEQIWKALPTAGILVIDDQSPDGTADLARDRFGHLDSVSIVSRDGPRGYGLAMRTGMERFLRSDHDSLITLDADLSHDPAAMTGLLECLPTAGVVIGSRLIGGVRAVNWPAQRLVTTIFGNRYTRMVTGLPFVDCTSGFRCYSRGALERLDVGCIRARDYAFLVETLYWLWRSGCPIVEAPIVYRNRIQGESKLRARVFFESLLQPWRLRLRRRATSPLHDRRPT